MIVLLKLAFSCRNVKALNSKVVSNLGTPKDCQRAASALPFDPPGLPRLLRFFLQTGTMLLHEDEDWRSRLALGFVQSGSGLLKQGSKPQSHAQ